MEDNRNLDSSSKNSINFPEKNKKSKLLSISNIISELLKNICEEGNLNNDTKLVLIKPFISKKIPAISIKDYMDRLLKYSKTFNEILIIVLIYLDTITTKHMIKLNYYNIHKFILAAFIAAIKFHEDEYYSIGYYAKLGGITKKEAITLEYEFMNLIDFRLFIRQELYDKYYNYLCNLEEENFDDDFD